MTRWMMLAGVCGMMMVGFAMGADNPRAPRGAEDLAAWAVPAQVPTIAGEMDSAELAQHIQKTVAKLNKKNLADKNHPLSGILYDEVNKGSVAFKAGIRGGDIVTAVKGEIAFKERYDHMMYYDEPIQITVWSYGKGRRDYSFPPGDIGVVDEHYIDLARAYWRGPDHDEKWDDAMLTAGALYSQQPRIAWNALALAQRQGASGPYFNLIAAMTAYELGRFDDCLSFGVPAIERIDPTVQPPLIWNLWSAGTLAGRLGVVQQVVDKYTEPFKDQSSPPDKLIDSLMAKYEALPESQRVSLPPLQLLKSAVVEDLVPTHLNFKPMDTPPDMSVYTYGYTDAVVKQWNANKKVHFACKSDDFVMGDVGPVVSDCVLTVDYSAKPHDKMVSGYAKSCDFGIRNYIPDTQTASIVLGVQCWEDGFVLISWEDAFGNWKNKRVPDVTGKHEIKMMVVNQRGMILLDGHAILDGVVVEDQASRQLIGFLRCASMDEDITRLQWGRVKVPVELP